MTLSQATPLIAAASTVPATDGDVITANPWWDEDAIQNLGGAEYDFISIGASTQPGGTTDEPYLVAITANGDAYTKSTVESAWVRSPCSDNRKFTQAVISTSFLDSGPMAISDGKIFDVTTCGNSNWAQYNTAPFKFASLNASRENNTAVALDTDAQAWYWGPFGGWKKIPAFSNLKLKQVGLSEGSTQLGNKDVAIALDKDGYVWLTNGNDPSTGQLGTVQGYHSEGSIFVAGATGLAEGDGRYWWLSPDGKTVYGPWGSIDYLPQSKYMTMWGNIILTIAGNPQAPTKHSLTFNLNGAPGTAPAPQQLDTQTPPTKPIDPEWAGHTFNGWYTASTGGSEFDFTKPIASDTTVYAQWTEDNGTTIACAPQTGADPAASIWQTTTILLSVISFGLAIAALRIHGRLRRRI